MVQMSASSVWNLLWRLQAFLVKKTLGQYWHEYNNSLGMWVSRTCLFNKNLFVCIASQYTHWKAEVWLKDSCFSRWEDSSFEFSKPIHMKNKRWFPEQRMRFLKKMFRKTCTTQFTEVWKFAPESFMISIHMV